jgi:two-component system alkaline phosphatase synthesis response regulator PhoP
MSHRSFRILVVEDDPAIRRGLCDALSLSGYEVLSSGDGDEGLELGLGAELDLVILDVVLPGKSGFEILPELRRCRPQLPIILVTARGAEEDRIYGLEHGADDYVVKPFSAKELLARVRAVLRRSAERPLDLRTIELGPIRIDFERREARRADQSTHDLSERECEILRYLASNPGRAISRHELLEKVWGMKPSGVHTRTVDMHVARLREKLGEDPKDPQVVRTVRGKGYMIQRNEA